MAEVVRPPETDDGALVAAWHIASANVETFGCGEADEADQQGVQPLISSEV